MQIEIWSDLVCPWCTIGKRRFEKALEKFEHRDEVTVQLRSFELDPNTQKDFDGTLNQWLAQRKGISLQQAEAMNDQVAELAAKEDLVFRLNQAKPANTFDAHRLTLLAEGEGKRVAMTERLYRAYFGEGEDLNDLATLARLASEAGLTASATTVTDMLQGDAFAEAVREEEALALDVGIRSVPFFLIDGKYAILGAQASDVFLNALQKAREMSQSANQIPSE